MDAFSSAASASPPTTTAASLTAAEAAAAFNLLEMSATALDMKKSVVVGGGVGGAGEQQQQLQKIKKCALKNKNTNFTKISQKCAKNLKTQKTTTTIKAKPKNHKNKGSQLVVQQPQQKQLLKQKQTQHFPTTKENFLLTLDLLAVVRRNASDKLKLIQMVHDNPILWDSRLPNFKGAEEEKNSAWEQIGREFNAPGRRVARAFKSLRESYRRELAHVKLMGIGFKPKWSLFEAMDFLRDVIRERKGGAHAAEHSAIGLNLSAFSQNNNNNHNKSSLKLNSLQSSFNDSALNLSKCSSLNMSHDDYYYFVKPELDLSGGGGGAGSGHQQPIPAHTQHPQQNAQHDSRVSSTRNDNSTQNATFDDMDASSLRSGDEDASSSLRNAALSHQGSDEVEELDAIDADFPYPLILDSNSPTNGAGGSGIATSGKRRRKDLSENDGDEDDDDDYDGQMLQQHRHLRQQHGGMELAPPQTVREVLNSKFCGFISAKLNSMEDSEADNLMNKILMLLVATQSNEGK